MPTKKSGGPASPPTNVSKTRKDPNPTIAALQAQIDRQAAVICDLKACCLQALDVIGAAHAKDHSKIGERSLVDTGLFLRVFFDQRRKRYWLRDESGRWQTRPTPIIQTYLKAAGVDPRKNRSKRLSELDYVIMFISGHLAFELPEPVETLISAPGSVFTLEQIKRMVEWSTCPQRAAVEALRAELGVEHGN